MRKIVLHYHLFKNAGTSVDEMLRDSFRAGWLTREFTGHGAPHHAAIARWIQETPGALAYSSHTAQLPPPQLPGCEVFPIVFMRHPIDRIASAYAFERKQGGEGFGSVLARSTSLRGYIEVRLALGSDRQCSNFHMTRLAQMFPPATGSESERAARALATLPFMGLVEDYAGSVQRLSDWLRPHFPDFQPRVVARNVSRDLGTSLDDKLAQIRDEVGADCYARLEACNAHDLALYDTLCRRLAQGSPDAAAAAPAAPVNALAG